MRRLPTVKLDGDKFEKLGIRVEEFSRFSPFVSLILGKVVKDPADFPTAFSLVEWEKNCRRQKEISLAGKRSEMRSYYLETWLKRPAGSAFQIELQSSKKRVQNDYSNLNNAVINLIRWRATKVVLELQIASLVLELKQNSRDRCRKSRLSSQDGFQAQCFFNSKLKGWCAPLYFPRDADDAHETFNI